VGGAAYHRVQIGLFDVKVDIESVEDIEVDVAEHAVDHLDVPATARHILRRLFADLDSR